MSFIPLTTTNINSSLFGLGAQPKILDESDLLSTDLYGRRIHAPSKMNSQTHLLLVLILSAVVFVTIIATYDVIKASINYGYSVLSLNDPNSHNNVEDIERTQLADYYALLSIISFFAFALMVAIILIPVLLCFIRRAAEK